MVKGWPGQAGCAGLARRHGSGAPGRSGQPITIFPLPEVPLRPQSATITITHAVTAAAGVFAPGHVGELTQYLPFELVDDVLEQTKTVQRRLRDLPSRTGVYFLLALASSCASFAPTLPVRGLYSIATRPPSRWMAVKSTRFSRGTFPVFLTFV